MDKKEEIAYIAGLLEGEGHFGFYSGTPSITISMTDLDIIERVKEILGGSVTIWIIQKENRKTVYGYRVAGKIAIEWMKIIYPLMGVRRREKIQEVFNHYENRNNPKVRAIENISSDHSRGTGCLVFYCGNDQKIK